MKNFFIFLLFFTFVYPQNLKILENKTDLKKENSLLLKAALSESFDSRYSYEIYKKIYAKYNKKEYLKKLIILSFFLQDELFDKWMQKSQNIFDNDEVILRIKISNLMQKNRDKEALNLAKKLLKIAKTPQNLSLIAEVYLKLDQNQNSINYFEQAYDKNPSEILALKIASIYGTKLKNISKSTQILENFTKNFGCSNKICSMLFDTYINEQKYQKAAQILQKLYKINRHTQLLHTAVDIYIFLKDFDNAKNILETYKINQKLLAEIYAYEKKYRQAYDIVKDEFQNTGNEEFKILMGIYKYEEKSPNLTLEDKKNIIQNFEISVQNSQNPTYLNYYGYFLIDLDIDVRKGITLIKEALKFKPDESYIIDSLAWGYYKIGECENAKIWMNKALKDEEFMKSEEAKLHFEKIINCKER